MAPKRATMNDVAKLAGVTQATVSYVINNSANISDEVKERVYEAIKQLNYSPNFNARALKTRTSSIVGIILPDIVNQYYSRMVEYLEILLSKKNLHTMVYTTSYNPEFEQEIIQRLLSVDVCGIIVLYQFSNPENWNILKHSGKTIIALEGGAHCSEIGIMNVRTNSFAGEYMATKFLLDEGAKRIAFIHQTAVNESLQDRLMGYTQAMKDAELFQPMDIHYINNNADFYQELKKVGEVLCKTPVDGIVSTSDLIAIGIIRQLSLHGIRVPDDVRIVGYDNVPFASFFIPALTTIAQPMEEICNRIIELLFSDDEQISQNNNAFEPKLIIRET
ncbi:hypothetical protein BXO88_10130 [Oribacterium sp. C9]|uniref:LacI family DNA-binding transcriptional regulator n=1 Tax=Oribacterium sp. C9 TaxID=1943579 RepID=UPI00098FE267|nr:LacI family DNA-binding transcriptional regulator [Oribacterium sp. C9]OON85975.1 hypothetical protein BXO88_10130 [Oribacterium sp. C9]